ncbi:vesicle coat component [Emydomyces testavorans]|uniref:Protein transport protein sec16 n=1 Tax=Emydomyces testavorans TaxID=2070801 RepID=A0AAF0IL10_9EURO|nr:vesicle coat component [Emydomyces testavorans]
MAEDSAPADYENGPRTVPLHLGSWNPALRPENDSDDPRHVALTSKITPVQIPESVPSPPVNSEPKCRDSTPFLPNDAHGDTEHVDYAREVSEDLPNGSHMDTTSSEEVGPVDEPQDSGAIPSWSGSPFIDSFQGSQVDARTNSLPDNDIDFQAMIRQTQEHEECTGDKSAGVHIDPSPSNQCLTGPHGLENNDLEGGSWNDTFMDDGDAGTDFFSHISSQTKPIYIPPETESRFDEGVPLINNGDTKLSREDQLPSAIEAIFDADDTSGDANFFSSQVPVLMESTSEAPPDFQRKSTSEVLSALNFDSNSPTDAAPRSLMAVVQEQKSKEAPATEPALNEDLEEDELAERWKAFLGDDDMLIEEEPLDTSIDASNLATANTQAAVSQPSITPAAPQVQSRQSRVNPYTPHQPSSSEMLQGTDDFIHPPKPAGSAKAPVESFSNQSKAGYQSPYDLPFEMRPKHAPARTALHPMGMNPPLRSSSMSASRASSSPYVPQHSPATAGPLPMISPPSSSGRDTTSPSTTKEPVRSGSFFEELPVVSRSRPSTRGRYTLQSTISQQPSDTPMAPPHSLPIQNSDSYSQFQLQPPARLEPYSTLPVPPSQPVPISASRYSPQPSSQQGTKPVPFPRYSPAPPQHAAATGPPTYVSQSPTVQTSVNTLPFQPRTSSPLAQHEPAKPFLSPPHKRDSLPAMPIGPMQYRVAQSAPDSQITPPKRSMTQSPGKMMSTQNAVGPNQSTYIRPASAHGSRSSIQTAPLRSGYAPVTNNRSIPELKFIAPMDGQEHDPLQRWKGAPIFRFGFGGTVLSTFPKRIPRYATGQLVPRIKPTVGGIKTCSISQVLSHNEPIEKFPGPLKSKSKKKDVLSWLSAMLSAFEIFPMEELSQLDPVQQRRREDSVLLWKVVKVLVEQDGVLSGSAAAEASLQTVFSQNANTPETIPLGLGSQMEYSGSNRSVNGPLQPEPTSALGVETIYNNLVTGDRQKAVWDAVDHRLWGHAMLISSTLDKSVWKQVIQEFIRREVRSLGENTESLAALYEVFAGNFEESIDELVPPSARAGLQMVSMHAGPGPAKNTLEGLDKWRDTVNLILKNRSSQDHQALLALGRLLASYGRVEAAHICCLIAGTTAGPIFGGANDPQVNIVLLGADHWRSPATFMTDRKACLLTEVYEFATSVLATPPSPTLPHLQAFKLQHAMCLAEEGHKSEAQQYCEAIGAIATSKSNVKSPHYHQRFFAELDELSHRLRQAPADGSSSWISKPSMEKVSGSVWAKFNSFVSGDDNEVTSNEPGKAREADAGPFAKITGTPPISRSPSIAEGYGSYFPSSQPIPVPSSSSRYAPNSQYAPYSSPEQSRGRRSLDAQMSPSRTMGRSYSQRHHSQDPLTPFENNSNYGISGNSYASPAAPGSHTTPPQLNYAPLAPVEETCSPQVQSPSDEIPAVAQTSAASFGISQIAYMSSTGPITEDTETRAGTAPSEQRSYQPSAYEPPSFNTGYEPPSYTVDSAENEHSEEEKPKKKSFMDDDEDDDFMTRAAQLKAAEKERQDREAAEAFRKAAEADAKRPSTSEKKGWFSGWFAKKDNANTGGPVRADLGDENSFYFDKELNRWVNKKDPGSTAAAAAAPPPPKGSTSSSRSVSTAQTPTTPGLMNGRPGPSTIPGGAVSAPPPKLAPLPTPPSTSLGPPSGSPRVIPRSVSAGVPTGPPSRPGTSLSNASSIDDLLGAPQARKAGTVKPRKKGRGYIDVMAK